MSRSAIIFVFMMAIIVSILVLAVPREQYVDDVILLLRQYEKKTKKDSSSLAGSGKRGIVMVAGGPTYGPMAYHGVQMIRKFNPDIPIEIFSLNREEQKHVSMQKLAQMPHVNLTSLDLAKKGRWVGWRSKILAIQKSSFEQILYMDADNQALGDVGLLFDLPEFKSTGAVFWPDTMTIQNPRNFELSFFRNWRINVPTYFDVKPNVSLLKRSHLTLEYEHETGQILLNKSKVSEALDLIAYLHDHYETVFRLFYGDKDVYQFAFSYLKTPFSQVKHRPILAGYLNNKGIFQSLGFLQRHPTTQNPLFYHRAGVHSEYKQKITHVQISDSWDNAIVVNQFGLLRYHGGKISPWDEQIVDAKALQITATLPSKERGFI